MKKIFITGGSGTVGTAFIKRYYNDYKFYSYSRGEKSQVALKRKFPNIEILIGGIEEKNYLTSQIIKINPDIIIHAAALKHVDTAEKQPIKAITSNIMGSYNIMEAAKEANTPLVVGISTDKACESANVYGKTKALMEKMYLEADNSRNKFVCCRFGNVAGSHGSVIPFWLRSFDSNKPLFLTHPNMTRLMFSPEESAELIHNCITLSSKRSGFIMSKIMKTVTMSKLAKLISEDIKIVGLRPGEKMSEDLISEIEIPHSEIVGDYVILTRDENPNILTRLDTPINSDTSLEMTRKEMIKLIKDVKNLQSVTSHSKNEY
jgi:FlaA1/EpsC-like NDP-sugar epimerase